VPVLEPRPAEEFCRVRRDFLGKPRPEAVRKGSRNCIGRSPLPYHADSILRGFLIADLFFRF